MGSTYTWSRHWDRDRRAISAGNGAGPEVPQNTNLSQYKYTESFKNVSVHIPMHKGMSIKECFLFVGSTLIFTKQFRGNTRWRVDVGWLYLCSYKKMLINVFVFYNQP